MTATEITNPNTFGTDEKRKIVSIGLIQTTVSDDIAANMKKTIERIEEASRKGAQIVCLQELYRTKYFPQEKKQDVSKLAETIPGESTRAFSELAKKKKIVIIAPIFEKSSNGKYYNSAAIIDANGKILGSYRKVHIPNDQFFSRYYVLKKVV
jgi:predicted amidohydrolase